MRADTPSGRRWLLVSLHILAILSFHRRLVQRLMRQRLSIHLGKALFSPTLIFAGAPEHNAQTVCRCL